MPVKAAPLLREVNAGDELVTSYVVDVLLKCKLVREKGSRKPTPTPCTGLSIPHMLPVPSCAYPSGAPATSVPCVIFRSPAAADDKDAEMMVVPVLLPTLAKLSSLRLYIPKDLKSKANKSAVGSKLGEVHRRFKDKGVPSLGRIPAVCALGVDM